MNRVNQSPYSPLVTRIMNGLLWTMQILGGIFFSFTGFGKVLAYDAAVWNRMQHQVAWFSAVPQGLFVFIGVCEGLGGVGLIVPAMTRVAPKLTALAAAGLALVMLMAAIFHIMRGEFQFFVPVCLVLFAVAAFIGFGRWGMPIAPAPIGTVRMLTGVAVCLALVVAGFVPVWYQSHPH